MSKYPSPCIRMNEMRTKRLFVRRICGTHTIICKTLKISSGRHRMNFSLAGPVSRPNQSRLSRTFSLSYALRVGASVLLAATLSSVPAQQPKAKTPGNDWLQLFNEKDLTGWIPIGAESWTVEGDGILHGKGLTKAYGYLESDKDYKDFQLSLRFKCVGDGNSGVFFHT